MNFEQAPRIIATLKRPIEHISYDAATKLLAEAKAEGSVIYGNPTQRRDRTLDEVISHYFLGRFGEETFKAHFARHHHDVSVKDALKSSFDYDLCVDGTYLELKFQALTTGTVEWSDYAKVKHAVENADQYDFMLCWKLGKNANVIPWQLINSEAFNPEHKLLAESDRKTGVYLKMNKSFKYRLSLN
jgi:hypothetical protein